MIKAVYATDPTPDAISDLFGKVTPPIGTGTTDPQTGLIKILNVSLNMVLVVAGLFVLLNLILAGYSYIMAGGDAKKVSEANLRITYTAIGLIIIVVAPLVVALLGIIIFGRWDAILNPDIKKLGP